MSLQATASQTVGPFFHLGMTSLNHTNLVVPGLEGKQITIGGLVTDGDGNKVADAILEVWQADSHGRYAHPEGSQGKPAETGFTGFGRIPTDEQGRYCFRTVKPGRVPGPGGKLQAPHIVVTIFARGLLKQLVTRIYFDGEAANAEDPILRLIPPERRSTLLARKAPGDPHTLEWNIVLQGEGETVFFDW